MDCRSWEELLERHLDGTLTAAERQASETHLAACGRCRDLLTAAEASRRILAGEARADLTDAILERTSGPPCRRAEELLPDLVEGRLGATDAQLVRHHLRHCRACDRLAVTLTWLLPELAEMGELAPDAGFTADVMAATVGADLRTGGILDRLRAWWRGVSARPRFAFEAAYVGTLLLVLLFGTPVSPLKETPPHLLAMIQTGPASLLASPLEAAGDELAALGGAAWGRSGGAVGAAVGELAAGAREDLARRRERAAPALRAAGEDARGVVSALLEADLTTAGGRLDELRIHLPQAWRAWWGAADDGADTVEDATADGA
jgi:hypothetical protein